MAAPSVLSVVVTSDQVTLTGVQDDGQSVDPSLSELDRFDALVQSEIDAQRLLCVRRLAHLSASLPPPDLTARIIPRLGRIACDPESSVRVSLCTELPHLQRLLVLSSASASCIPTVSTLLADTDVDVRQGAIDAALLISQYLSDRECWRELVPVARALIAQTADDLRATGAQLVLRLARWVAPGDARAIFTDLLPSLLADASFRVRKGVAVALADAAAGRLPTDTANLLPPVVEALAKDPIWSVRQAAIQAINAVADCLVDRAIFIPVMVRACDDASRWVRNQAHLSLGQFLYRLPAEAIDADLLSLYTRIPTLPHDASDNDANFACAFDFPAVIARIGSGRWPEVSVAYLSLCHDPKFKVRRTLAYSLHAVARVLGPELTDAVLAEYFGLFFKDLEEVRAGIVATVADVLRAMSPQARLRHVDMLWEIQRETNHNWRFRWQLAGQLVDLSSMLTSDALYTTVIALALQLLHDRVAAVRKAALQAVGPLLMQCSGEAYDELLSDCLALASASACHDRQLFALLCQSLLGTIPPMRFRLHFLAPMTALASDRVINVRRTLERVLNDIPRESPFYSDPAIVSAKALLREADQQVAIRKAAPPSHTAAPVPAIQSATAT